MEIKSNYHWRLFLYGHELTEKERKELDYMSSDAIDSGIFLRYRGLVYTLDQFLRADAFPGWEGLHSDTYFSGILIRLSSDGEMYQIATCYS